MLHYDLRPIFRARQIDRPYSALVKAGISPTTASRILAGDVRVIRTDHVEAICRVLHCTPNDLFSYKPDKKHPLPDGHPLLDFVRKETYEDWQQKVKTMPLSELQALSRLVDQAKEESDQ